MTRTENTLALGAVAVVTAGSLYTDSFGAVGHWVSAGLGGLVGHASWLVPLWVADMAVRTFLGRHRSISRALRWSGMLTLVALSMTLVAGLPGGWVGSSIAAVLVTAIGFGALLLVLGTWFVVVLRLIGRDRVNAASDHFAASWATAKQQVLTQQRARLSAGPLRPVFAPVIDTQGVTMMAPPPVPVGVAPPPVRPAVAAQAPAEKPAPARPVARKPSRWDLPDVDLLAAGAAVGEVEVGYRERVAANLAERLQMFRLPVTVEPAEQQGAIVSRYEITPSAGVDIQKIRARSADLESAYAGFRFVALPGSGGKLGAEIPVPQANRSPIALRSVLDSPEWTESTAKLPLALGVTSSGDPIVIDLDECPHLLVAGATRSGKSVGLSCMLASILLRQTPADAQLLLIDPKAVELSRYRGLPHLMCPPVTETADALERLRGAVEEMERRYRLLLDADDAENIEAYNSFVKPAERLPRIVIVIDEYGDLVLTAQGKLIEECVTRLGAKARAAGIHVILATQRPSVDVVSGIIKANFIARIAYKTGSRKDSETILDASGAQLLLGYGDSLCLMPQKSTDLLRVHGAYVSKDETKAICQAWREQTNGERPEPPPRQVETPAPEPEQPTAAPTPRPAPAPAQDDMFARALQVAKDKGNVSARVLGKELRLGHDKATAVFQQLQQKQLIKPGGPNNTHVYCGDN